MDATEHRSMHKALSALYRAAEQARESGVAKWTRYSKNKRFRAAASYWEGFAQAAACQRHIIGAQMRATSCWPPDHFPPEHPNCRSAEVTL